MKINFSIKGLLALITGKSTAQPANEAFKTEDTIQTHSHTNNAFEDMRNMALNFTPEQLQIKLPPNQTTIYGVVMDWEVGEGIATLICFSTGDASMYLSTGGGIIGGGQHENVSTAAKAFIIKSQSFLDKSAKVDATPLPDKNCIRFYLLTNKGKFAAQEHLSNFENKSSPWLSLFEEGNKVITALRLVEGKKQ